MEKSSIAANLMEGYFPELPVSLTNDTYIKLAITMLIVIIIAILINTLAKKLNK